MGGSDPPPQGWLQLLEELKPAPAQPSLLEGLFFRVGGTENAEQRAAGLGFCKAPWAPRAGCLPLTCPAPPLGLQPWTDRGAVQKSQHTVAPDRPQQTAHPCRSAHRALLTPTR